MKPGPIADAVHIAHMLDCIEKVQAYTAGGEASFRSSTLIQDAVIRNLQTMAESAQKLSEDLKTQYPSVPWRAIAGFRNIIVHDYLGIDLDVVWSVVDQELSTLKKALMAMKAG